MIEHPAFAVEPWAVTEDGAAARRAGPVRVGLRALQRPHRAARQPRGGRAVRAPRDVPERVLRDAPAAVRRGRLRLPGGRPDRRQRHQRQDHPAAGRRRAVRHPLRRAARPPALARPARRARSTRTVHWRSPSGREIEVRTERLVSFVQRSVAAIRYEVRPCDGRPLRVVAQSELVANEPSTTKSDDPRAAAAMRAPLVAEEQEVHDHRVVLVHRTKQSGLRMAAGMDHVIEEVDGLAAGAEAAPDLGRVWLTGELGAGRRAAVHEVPRLRLVEPALAAVGARSGRRRRRVRQAHRLGQRWLQGQRDFLDDFWAHADVEIDGDGELQQAVRFALFHALQAGARVERRAIPAKGLTGPGYDGHAFWDTETYVLPLLTYTQPRAAADALRWRHETLDLALERAKTLGLNGAAFPWRTIRGQECSAYWPAGTAGLPHQCRHRRRRHPLPAGHRRRGVRGRAGPRAAGADGAAVALARPPRPRGRVPHRRRDRPGRVLGAGRRQRLHEPDGRAEPARWRPRSRRATRMRRPRSASTTRRSPPGATPPRRCTCPTTSG